jgi:penicillin-binding protein 1C
MVLLLVVAGTFLLLEAAIVVALRRIALRTRSKVALGLALGALAPLLVLALYARFAPLESPYARLEGPGLVVLGADGAVLQRDASSGLRIPTTLDRVAPVMVEATIAAEDARFRSHPGIDPIATARAVVTLPFRRSGASTLTQQLARRLYLSDFDGPVLERKTREALLALQLEARYSKDEILELYLNNVYYGNGAYGIEAAARVYFGVSAANLDLAQAAFLAGLPQAPGAYGADPASAATLGRRDYVLDRLVETGKVSRFEAEAAGEADLGLLPPGPPTVAPHFVRFALEELASLRPDLAVRQDLVIQTTLDAVLQAESEDIVKYYVGQLEDREVGNAAVVVLEPGSGRVLTMVGSAAFQDETIAGQYNMALQPRQPGSALKPFLYLAALENGYTAATTLLDVPVTFDTESGPYTPLNYDRRFNGPVPLRVALASSLNVPAVHTLHDLGTDAFLEVAHRFGLRTLTDAEVYGLALTLGGGEMRLLDLTAAYGAIANAGRLVEPYAIERILDTSGRVLYERRPSEGDLVASPEAAFVIADILADREARKLGFGGATVLDLPFRAAAKTGTTTEFRDNWTLGFTSDRVVGVWAGNADNRPMVNVSGVTGAGPIWHAVMEATHRGLEPAWPPAPQALTRATVCSPTGEKPGPHCPSRMQEWFLAGTEPSSVEAYYVLDESGRLVIDPPVEARGWAIEAGVPLASSPATARAGMTVFPADGSVFFLAPEVPGQALLLRASVPSGVTEVQYWVDGSLFAVAGAGDPAARWPVRPGVHQLLVKAVTADGRLFSASSTFQVKP